MDNWSLTYPINDCNAVMSAIVRVEVTGVDMEAYLTSSVSASATTNFLAPFSPLVNHKTRLSTSIHIGSEAFESLLSSLDCPFLRSSTRISEVFEWDSKE